MLTSAPESTPSRIQRLVDSLAERLGRPVLLDDPTFRPLAHSPLGPEQADRVRTISILSRQAPPDAVEYLRAQGVGHSEQATRIPANGAIGLDARLCQPVCEQDRALGYLWVVDGDDPLSSGDAELVLDVSVALAEQLSRSLSRAEEFRLHSRIHELLRSDPAISYDAAAALLDAGAFPSEASAAALVADVVAPPGEQVDETIGVLLSRGLHAFERGLPARRHLALARGNEAIVLVGDEDAASLEGRLPELAATLLEHLAAAAPDSSWEVAVGIGSVTQSLAGAPRSYREAVQAATVAARVPQIDQILPFAEIGIYRLLVPSSDEEAGDHAIPPSLTRLLEHPGGEMLLHTLETYLDCAGDAQATTAELFLARGSLYYRLHRIEEIAEVDLRSGHDRLVLHLGLKLARINRLYPLDAARENAGARSAA